MDTADPGLRVLTKLGYGDDERMRDAAYLVMSKRRPDGRWVLENDWFSQPGESTRWLSKNPGGRTHRSMGKLDSGLLKV